VAEDRYLIVLPTYNERENLASVVEALEAVRALTPFGGDTLIVDDNSPDGTGTIADELAADRVPAMLEAAADADLVLGSRYVSGGGVAGWPLSRKLISRGGCTYARIILGVPIRDLTGGFKCFRRWVLERLDLSDVHAGGYAFQIELTYRTLRMGGRVVELPITFTDRTDGQSKMSRSIVLEAVREVPALRLRALRGHLLDGAGGERQVSLVP
jgi:dolichol-phosphate mannosyltransferase